MILRKYCGVTLLFFQKKDSKYVAFLKSYVLKANNLDELERQVKSLLEKNKIASYENVNNFINETLYYVGIEDIFTVSGAFEEFAMLGKSYLDDHNTLEKTRELLLNSSNYDCMGGEPNRYNWFLVSLIFLYEDKKDNDCLAISCLTAVKGIDYIEIIRKITKKAVTKSFKRRILYKTLDRMNYEFLTYVGVENISDIIEDTEYNGAFDIVYRDFYSLKELLAFIPDNRVFDNFKWTY